MHKLRELLRLRWQQKLSVRQISDSIGVSAGFISQTIRRTTALLLTWDIIESLTVRSSRLWSKELSKNRAGFCKHVILHCQYQSIRPDRC